MRHPPNFQAQGKGNKGEIGGFQPRFSPEPSPQRLLGHNGSKRPLICQNSPGRAQGGKPAISPMFSLAWGFPGCPMDFGNLGPPRPEHPLGQGAPPGHLKAPRLDLGTFSGSAKNQWEDSGNLQAQGKGRQGSPRQSSAKTY